MREPIVYCSAARCLLLTSRSSVMVSLVPLPFGRETQGLVPSPSTKMFEILGIQIQHITLLAQSDRITA